jgi:hypothetical protein
VATLLYVVWGQFTPGSERRVNTCDREQLKWQWHYARVARKKNINKIILPELSKNSTWDNIVRQNPWGNLGTLGKNPPSKRYLDKTLLESRQDIAYEQFCWCSLQNRINIWEKLCTCAQFIFRPIAIIRFVLAPIHWTPLDKWSQIVIVILSRMPFLLGWRRMSPITWFKYELHFVTWYFVYDVICRRRPHGHPFTYSIFDYFIGYPIFSSSAAGRAIRSYCEYCPT